jgi:hypothetical protein
MATIAIAETQNAAVIGGACANSANAPDIRVYSYFNW